MHTLVIRHAATSDPPRFIVERLGDGRAGPETLVPAPDSVPVEGRPNDTLSGQLRWYLEQFLSYPFDPELDHAVRVRTALKTWGQSAFNALFTPPPARRHYEQAVGNGFDKLTLRIMSDSPAILAWPWESLEDPEAGRLAIHCQMERRLNAVRDPDTPKELPKDRVNVLLVIARPDAADVKYRSIARPLVEMVEKQNLPVSIHVLRPPTFDGLHAHLKAHPAHYHILHFDGHGSYRDDVPPSGGGNVPLRAREGRLRFEKDDGTADLRSATTLSELLRDCAVPAVVLNACQSAMLDVQAVNEFASVATGLLKAGFRGVVAMAYKLYVSGAQQFLPPFYTELFAAGNLAQAVRAGRQAMFQDQERVCYRGTHPLEDWMVPVLYQQDPPDFTFASQTVGKATRTSRLPEEARDDKNPYGFIGRDGAVLDLERALHRDPAGILITGLGGVGKTTLARGFLKWLEETNGLGDGAFWFSFVGLRSTEYVFNRLGEAILKKPDFATLDPAKKVEELASALRTRRVLIVWDNFESVKGIAGTAVTANLSAEDANRLKDFLGRLRGGKTKVLITSRSPEDWLGATNRGKPISLSGLDGEERWEYANTIVADLGLKVDRTQSEVAKLMDVLKGHPLAMRVMLTRLERQTAAQLIAALGTNFAAARADAADESEAMLFATLRFATDALPAEWSPLLIPLSHHEGYVHEGFLTDMAKRAAPQMASGVVAEGLQALAQAGLLHQVGIEIYELHPLVSGYLRSACGPRFGDAVRDLWERTFVDTMGKLADKLAPLQPHKQREAFAAFEASFQSARVLASLKAMHFHHIALTQSLAAFALNTHRLESADSLYHELASKLGEKGQEIFLANVYHQLGLLAQQRRYFVDADQWYRKSLEIKEWLQDEKEAAITYHQMGRIAEDRRNLDGAEGWYQKALDIFEQRKMNQHAAITYHHMGIIAEQRRNFVAAVECYRKSLDIDQEQRNEQGAASTYHHLGRIAQEEKDFDAAMKWYQKCLDIEVALGNEDEAAITYHQLGRIAELRGDLTVAEGWCRKAVVVFERLKLDHHAAASYHQLGVIAERRGDFIAAWGWYLKAIAVFIATEDEHSAEIVFGSLARSYYTAPPEIRPALLALGREAGLPAEILTAIENAEPDPPPGS
jgi:tetratricopeptide (TPR) repeat protein